jgi:membrane associated rhomboid family serine protease
MSLDRALAGRSDIGCIDLETRFLSDILRELTGSKRMRVNWHGRISFETPHAAVYALVILNVAAYSLCAIQSGAIAIPNDLLFRSGAMYSVAINRQEYWRLVTYGFLHADVFHLVTNMFCLILWGGFLEKRIGSLYFLLVYMSALVAGGVVSNATHANAYLMIGASGAISGILGALLCLWILGKINLSVNFFVINLGLNVALALSNSRIDWGAHFGGFAVGLISCALLDVLEKVNPLILRCKFPEFVKLNSFAALGAISVYWLVSPPMEFLSHSADWQKLLAYSILCLVTIKLLDLMLSVKKGLALIVVLFALANAAIALLAWKIFASAFTPICATANSGSMDQIKIVFGAVCMHLDLIMYLAALCAFALTILVYRPELHRGITDVGFVGATLRAERRRRQGV